MIRKSKKGGFSNMDLGVLLSDVSSYATTTLTGFGVIIASGIGLAWAIGAVKKLIRTR